MIAICLTVLLSSSCAIFNKKPIDKPDYGPGPTTTTEPKEEVVIAPPISKPEPVTKPPVKKPSERMDTIQWNVVDDFKGKELEKEEVVEEKEEEEKTEEKEESAEAKVAENSEENVSEENKLLLEELKTREAVLDEKIAKAEARHADKKLSDNQLLAIREEITQKRFEIEREKNNILGLEKPTFSEGEVVEIQTDTMVKGNYTVAIMMPFLTNQYTSFGPIPDKSKRALEFYEGVKMALNDLQAQGVPMTIYVFDTQYSEHVVQSLLNSGPLYEADMIIGPVSRKNCELVAAFGRANGKVVVSPYNYVSVVEQNPYYVQVSPSVQTQYIRVFEYVKQKFPSRNVLIMAPAGKRAVDQRIQEIQFANGTVNQGGALPVHTFSVMAVNQEPMQADRFLMAGQNNIVVIPSRDPGFVAYCMRELNPYRRSHRVTVVGMPQWEEPKFEKVDYNYYGNLNLVLGSESYIDKDNAQIRNFMSRYQSEYGTIPTENVFKGYDIMSYFGQMLKQHGIYFPSHLSKTPGRGMHTTFKFEPVYGAAPVGATEPVITRFENSYLNILEFDDFEFRDVTPY